MHHSHNPLEVGQNASRMWLKNICPFIGLIKKKKNPLVFASFLFCDFIVIQEVCFSIGTSISSKTIPLSSNFEPVHWSDSDCCMSGSTCHFLTCIQISQEAGKVFWYSHLFKNFPPFFVIHTVKGFSIVNEAEVEIFLERSCFLNDPVDVGNLISGSSAFSKSNMYMWNF